MGSYKKYKTASALEKKVDAYFDSISRTITAKEKVDTGKKDKYGHAIYKLQPILNDNGEEIKLREFVVPPSLTALCLYLGISRQTWDNYGSTEIFFDTVMRAGARVESYLATELNSRTKGVDGIKFNLMHNFGWKEKMQVDGSAGAVEKYLTQLPNKNDEF